MGTPFQPNVSLNQAIFNACDALAVMAGTERPVLGVDAIWQIEKKGASAIVEAGPSISHVITVVSAIETLLASAQLESYSLFTYNGGGDITNKRLYADSTMADLLYVFDYTYSEGNLVNIKVTRASDSFTYNKIFTYNIGGDLVSKEIVA